MVRDRNSVLWVERKLFPWCTKRRVGTIGLTLILSPSSEGHPPCACKGLSLDPPPLLDPNTRPHRNKHTASPARPQNAPTTLRPPGIQIPPGSPSELLCHLRSNVITCSFFSGN